MRTRPARGWRPCMALCLVAFLVDAAAGDGSDNDTAGPRGEITLAQALDAALARNPDLAASTYELTAAQARIVQADKRLNPEVSLELENFAGTGDTRGTRALETTLAISQVVELGGKRSLRRSAAESASGVTAIELQAAQLDLLAEVTRRYIDVVAAQQRRSYAIENTALAAGTLEAISARVKAARSPVAEESRARIALTRARIEERQSELELEGARRGLSLGWGQYEPQFSSARADLFDFPPLAPIEVLADRIEANPDALRFASESRLRDAELRLAQAQARPNIAFNLGVRRLEASSDTALVAGFSMPLPVYDRNQGGIQEARVRRSQVDAQQRASRTRALGALHALYREAQAAAERTIALRDQALPQARDALSQTQYGYERGRFSFLELLTSQQDVLALNESSIDAAADYHRLLAEIERLTNTPLALPNSEATQP
jgi:outer membrane protein, heavy metal efflux system